MSSGQQALKMRVERAAEEALARQHHVCAIDVLCGMGLLASTNVDSWRHGRIDYLERFIQGSPGKISSSLALFHGWARQKNLTPSEAEPMRNGKQGPVPLRITQTAHPELEKLYYIRYLSGTLPEPKQQQLANKLSQPDRPVVFEILRDSECVECGTPLERGAFLFMDADQPLCLLCSGFADLEYLPAGDTALTRRASKYSARVAVVVRFSRSRGRYERQGLLVETPALEQAEQECLEDADERAEARERATVQRRQQDHVLVEQMTSRIGELFPGCSPDERAAIAAHTAVRGSGRVGRTEAGRTLEPDALTAAVIASIRHRHTNYDELLAQGVDRATARQRLPAPSMPPCPGGGSCLLDNP